MLKSLLVPVALLLCAGLSRAETPSLVGDIQSLTTQVRLDVDREGRVVASSIPDKLAPELVSQLSEQAAQWRFEPVRGPAGEALGGVTYAAVELCLLSAGDDAQVLASLLSNGPGSADRSVQIPRFPPSAIRAGVKRAELLVTYVVGSNGKAVLDDLQVVSGADAQDFRASIMEWLRSRRFRPEILDGKAVATRVQEQIELIGEASATGRFREPVESAADSKPACAAGQGSGAGESKLGIRVIDSPFRPVGQD